MYLYVNGEIKPDHDVRISPYEHGFLYGAGLFETFRTYGGEPFLLKDHLARLEAGARELAVELPASFEEEIRQAAADLLEANQLEDAYFRLNVSGGAEGVGLPAAIYGEPLTILYIKPLPDFLPEQKEVRTLKLRRNSPEGAVRRKSHHYLNNILAKREIQEHGNTEGIFLTENGVLSEGITSNLFFVKKDQLYTPDESCGCLNGITSRFVKAIAEELGLRVVEGRFSLKKALEADEVFLTNSIQEIVPVSAWDEHFFPGSSGEKTTLLQSVYRYAADRTENPNRKPGGNDE
ncbi:aminodeoxychorismate lyase [Alkalicoccus halolimnae]|uniref:Aminodeoxychorismate lyase n=1 Tax=Alkalicoccus halolimnae TaxID=1667239 RepID=A0A5C7FG67_9BACI|nr:aminodeoxychorismate lyase [Alkalicoccus halolimnae]TXF82111.1 aminodeoxychorismate lyase [Alkalicoccus halolimnae]